MNFRIGNYVMASQLSGPDRKGKIIDIRDDLADRMYAVQFENELFGTFYLASNLTLIIPKSPCTCGAVAAHKPNTPPGHAHYCDLNQELFK